MFNETQMKSSDFTEEKQQNSKMIHFEKKNTILFWAAQKEFDQ